MKNNIKFMSLSSGSCGNCYYLGTSEGGILIDAGVSLRRVKKALIDNGLDIKYDRLAVLSCSLFALSHWRNDVTIASYLLVI